MWTESGFQWHPVEPAEPRPSGRKYQGRHVLHPAILSAPVLTSQDAPASEDALISEGTLTSQDAGTRTTGDALIGQGTLITQDVDLDQTPGTKRRVVTIVLPSIALAAVAAVAIALLTGSSQATPSKPQTIGMYSGQQQRGVFQQINAIATNGRMIITTGSQSSDGLVRQQFFLSSDGGATWRLAPVTDANGGQPPLGHAATVLAEGQAGWLAIGPQATWTSKDGLTWTLRATHGITSEATHGTAAGATRKTTVETLTATADGFLAGGADGGQGSVWLSPDGMTWQQLTGAQLGLAPGETLDTISAAASRGPDTLVSGTVTKNAARYAGVWLTTDGGLSWTRVTVPADHGATAAIAGLGSGATGLLAVRPGGSTGAVAYVSPNGRDWQYAGTIDPAGGWTPTAVNGFAVTGKTTANTYLTYTKTGTTWSPTGDLGAAASESVLIPDGTVVAAGSAGPSAASSGAASSGAVGQQAVLLEASRAGKVRAVPLAAIPGAVVPELSVNDVAAAGNVQVAVGSANGYPAIWRRQQEGSWTLESPAELTSGQTRLAALTSVTKGPKGWLAVGAPGPLAYVSADGVTWQPAPGNIAQALAGADAATAAAGPAGYVISTRTNTWWSPDLTRWRQSSGIAGGVVLAAAADAHGFVAVGSGSGQPVVWTTSDGRSWTRIALPVPAGASSAVLQRVAVQGTRVVALGQATTPGGVVPLAELSANGGATWLQVPFTPPGPDTTFTALVAGAHGFAAVGEYRPAGQEQPGQMPSGAAQAWPAAWTSADGTAWTRSRLTGLDDTYRITALDPAASPGSAATAIGSVATQRSQGAFLSAVPMSGTRTRR